MDILELGTGRDVRNSRGSRRLCSTVGSEEQMKKKINNCEAEMSWVCIRKRKQIYRVSGEAPEYKQAEGVPQKSLVVTQHDSTV